MATITMQVPDDLLPKLKNSGLDVSEEIRLEAAFSLCSRGALSTSQAARLAGLFYADFLEAAARAKVQLFPVDLDELAEAVNLGHALGGQCVAGHPADPGGAI